MAVKSVPAVSSSTEIRLQRGWLSPQGTGTPQRDILPTLRTRGSATTAQLAFPPCIKELGISRSLGQPEASELPWRRDHGRLAAAEAGEEECWEKLAGLGTCGWRAGGPPPPQACRECGGRVLNTGWGSSGKTPTCVSLPEHMPCLPESGTERRADGCPESQKTKHGEQPVTCGIRQRGTPSSGGRAVRPQEA